MYLVGGDFTLPMYAWFNRSVKSGYGEIQFYAMVDQVAEALDAIKFNVLVAQCKNCKYFVGKIDSSWT